MNVVPFEKQVKYEIHISSNKEVEKQVVKNIEKELAKGYIKLLSNFCN